METTWLPRHARVRKPAPFAGSRESLERETGFEPATSTLARSHSTAELLPLVLSIIAKHFPPEQWPRCVEAQANDDQVPFAGTDTADDCHSEWRSDESVVPCFGRRQVSPPVGITMVRQIRVTILKDMPGVLTSDESTQRGAVHCGSNSGVTISPSRR